MKKLIELVTLWDGTLLVLGMTLGLTLGLAIGWLWWPVQWKFTVSQQMYIHYVADLFAYNHDQKRVKQAMEYWDSVDVTCQMLEETHDTASQTRLWLVLVTMGEDCQ